MPEGGGSPTCHEVFWGRYGDGKPGATLCGGLSRVWIRRGIKLGAELLASRLRGRPQSPPGALALVSPLPSSCLRSGFGVGGPEPICSGASRV